MLKNIKSKKYLDKIVCAGHHLGLEVGRLPLGAGRAKMTLDLGPDLSMTKDRIRDWIRLE